MACVGILAREPATWGGTPPSPAPAAVPPVAADPPPIGVEVKEVIGVLFLAARLEDGPNFKLICLSYAVVALLFSD